MKAHTGGIVIGIAEPKIGAREGMAAALGDIRVTIAGNGRSSVCDGGPVIDRGRSACRIVAAVGPSISIHERECYRARRCRRAARRVCITDMLEQGLNRCRRGVFVEHDHQIESVLAADDRTDDGAIDLDRLDQPEKVIRHTDRRVGHDRQAVRHGAALRKPHVQPPAAEVGRIGVHHGCGRCDLGERLADAVGDCRGRARGRPVQIQDRCIVRVKHDREGLRASGRLAFFLSRCDCTHPNPPEQSGTGNRCRILSLLGRWRSALRVSGVQVVNFI